MAPRVEKIDEIGTVNLGEGPHWDADSQSLYFVDILGKSIHRYVPATKKYTKAVIGTNAVSLIIPVKGEKDRFVVSIGRELSLVTWDGVSDKVSNVQKIYEVENNPNTINNRFNDGKCDPSGRLWAGTMDAEPVLEKIKRENGYLYSFQNNKATTHIGNIGISNGLAWNTELNKFYYIDSHKQTVEEYDFDIKNGTIANGKPIFTLAKHNITGLPDGMAIDTEGNLWVAVYNSSSVIKIDPRRPDTLLETIPIPAMEVTSVAFGGPNLDELYVTTANSNGTYRVTGINAKGFPGQSAVL